MGSFQATMIANAGETVRSYLANGECRKAVASEEHRRFQASYYDAENKCR
jgi:hypothetical protein